LRVPEHEVGRLTLAEYDALLQRKRAQDERVQLNAGVIAAAVINSQGGFNGKPAKPSDFVPSLQDQVRDLTELSAEEQKAYIFAMFGSDPNGKSLVQVKG